jgi:hypothetical protein
MQHFISQYYLSIKIISRTLKILFSVLFFVGYECPVGCRLVKFGGSGLHLELSGSYRVRAYNFSLTNA